jgi:hypothetical protein
MAQNTQPIFPLVPKINFGFVTTANTAKDGTGTIVPVFTAGAFGSRLDTIRIRARGTNVATVLRVFINNGQTNTTATNNTLFTERTIASTTLSEVAALAETEISFTTALPAGYVVFVTIGTTIAAGLNVTGVGGDY